MAKKERVFSALPSALGRWARHQRPDAMSRREFLALASTFGASTAAAYAMLGLPAPARAARHAQMGGTVRIQMSVRPLKDPRTFDWTQVSNFTRGWLEYLVHYENDGTFTPRLLENWELSEDATRYVLQVREGVTWNDGTPFTAEDVARNISGWCDKSVEGNSMAGRFAVLVDPATDQAIDGGIEVAGSHTVVLNLPRPDISLIAGMADYPAAITPRGFSADTMLSDPVGTGPYLPEMLEEGARAVLVRNEAHDWWNAENEAFLDRIEFIDTGTDPAAMLAAVQADAVDHLDRVDGTFIDIMSAQPGWVENSVESAATIVIRGNQKAEIDGDRPYAAQGVRRAIQKAVHNGVVLELGYANRGVVAQNHHVAPVHPEYSDIGDPVFNPREALDEMRAAGMEDFEHELVSLDDGWNRDTGDAVAALMLDAGLNVRRTVLHGSVFWDNWASYPFSVTEWNHRPLGVQILALAYRSGEAWNETGFANAEFDDILEEALGTVDLEARRALVAQLQTILRDEAVIIQPFWRTLYNHSRAGLKGAEHHITFEIRPERIFWEQA